MYFSAAASSEKVQGSNELGLEHLATGVQHPVKCCGHPFVDRVSEVLLDVSDGAASIAFVPAPIQVLRDDPKLDEQISGQVLRLKLAALFAPKPNERGLIIAHDNAGVRTANKGGAFGSKHCPAPIVYI
jgi:hypothetical protein